MGYARSCQISEKWLDEVGAMSIIMSTRWTDADTPYFFHHLTERLEGREQEHGQELLNILHSDTARSILRQKLCFIGQFSEQLRDELAMTISWQEGMQDGRPDTV